MGYNNKWHHIQQTSPGVSPTSISNLSGFLCPVSVYNALEMAILVILTLRIRVKLVQRLVRGRPDPLGPGPSHSLWVWTESEEGMEGSDRHPYDPAFLCVMGLRAQLAITDVALKLTPSFWPVVTPLFYAACHVQHDCNIFCLTHIQLYLLLFLTSLPGISLRQTFLPLFILKSLFATVLFHIKACNLTLFALRSPKSLESCSEEAGLCGAGAMSWGRCTRFCYWKQTDLSMLFVFFFFSLPGIWLGYLPASSVFSLSDSVCCGQSCLARGYALWLCLGKPVSHMFSICCVKNVRPLLELLGGCLREMLGVSTGTSSSAHCGQ